MKTIVVELYENEYSFNTNEDVSVGQYIYITPYGEVVITQIFNPGYQYMNFQTEEYSNEWKPGFKEIKVADIK